MTINSSPPPTSLSLIGIGPGDLQQLTLAARTALAQAEVVIGYQVYIKFVHALLEPGTQEIIVSPIGNELDRAEQAVDLTLAGRRVALISSGDIGIYAMASPVFDVLRARGWTGAEPTVAIYPGISAIQAVAARVGAPLGHDFCTISLSDLLTPWTVIERRLQAAAWGDFVVAFYNPRSQKRDWQLTTAIDILLASRPADTPVAIVRNVTRPDETVTLTTLADLDPTQVDMFTLVLVGNSQSYLLAEHFVTPRGYVASTETNHASPQESIQKLTDPPHRPAAKTDVYPLTLTNMTDVKAIVIGGGPVGERKVRGLLAAGARIRFISPEATAQLQAWAETGQIEWTRRPYQPGDLAGGSLIFAATNQRAVNAQIAEVAKAQGALCNIADRPSQGNFHVPAVHRQPDLVIAVSTAGTSPTQARKTRDKIADWLDKQI